MACAMELALEKPTAKYSLQNRRFLRTLLLIKYRFVDFAMSRVRMLIHFGVVPYMVFDGDYLPSKAATELQRSKKRETSRKVGLELHRMEKFSQAHLELQKAVDVTPEMARQLIDELIRQGVQYVVAPYEADAQLVYLERKGFIQGILSEDSDLLVFGAKCLLTKLDQYGECIAIYRKDFATCRDISFAGWSDTEFRRMAILSGCDYLPSINKMGLKTAYRLVRKHRTIEKIVRMLQFDGQYLVPPNYLENFRKAEMTFLHQRVFCPDQKKLVMASEINIEKDANDLSFIGDDVQPSIALRVAMGDLHPMTKQPIVTKVRASGTTKSQWAVSKKQYVALPPESKFCKPIESYYKHKRVPLAELDPNNLTPSQSQSRVLSRLENIWSSGQVFNSLSSHSTIPFTPLDNVSSPSLRTRPTCIGTLSSASEQSAKRSRLCEDLDEESIVGGHTSAVEVETRRSRFFTSSAPKPNPSIEREGNPRNPQTKAMNIWSDDSLEDATVGLPNSSANTFITDVSQKPTIKSLLESPKSEVDAQSIKMGSSFLVQPSAKTLSEPLQSAFLTAPSRSSDENCIINQRSKEQTGADLPSLKNRFICQPLKVSNHVDPSKAHVQRAFKPVKGADPERGPQLKRLKSSTFLRAVQPKNVAKTLAHVTVWPRPSLSAARNKSELRPTHPRRLMRLDNSTQNLTYTARVQPLSCRGSEDLIIPDSDEELDETKSRLEVVGYDGPKFDVARFEFKEG